MNQSINRRQALVSGAVALTTLNSLTRPASATQISNSEHQDTGVAPNPAKPAAPATPSICVFTKPFVSLGFDELSDRIAELGFDGIEAPIRKGGHVEPAKVADELPRLVEALKQRQLEISVMASDINDASDPMTRQTLEAASELGIKQYRMKYLKYDLKKSVSSQIEEWKSQLRDLAALNRELGIQAVYQNHAGANNLGAPIWDLTLALEGINPLEIGVAYDIRHAVVEGAMSWKISHNAIQEKIASIYVKDFTWENGKLKNVPLGDGHVPREFFQILKKDIASGRFAGPISLHEEYLDHRKPELIPQHLKAIKQDVATLRKWIKT